MLRKRTLFTLLSSLILLFCTSLNAKINLHSSIEAPPQFPGGMDQFFKYIRVHTPLNGNSGKTEISFYINKDGTVDVPILSSESRQSNSFALLTTLVKGPKWRPGVQNGRLMKVGFVLAVTFETIDKIPVITVDHINVIKEEMIVAFEEVEENGDMYIRGTVTKTNGEPLAGVTIWSPVPPVTVFSGTNTTGEFSMALPASRIVSFSCIGHVAKEIKF